MKRFYVTISFIGLSILCMLAACKKAGGSGDGNSLYGTYDQQAMLSNIGNNVIVPGIKNFASTADLFNTKVNAFISAPDAGSLKEVQTAFEQLAISWASIAPFDFGPISDNLWFAQIDTWPVNTSKIETAVSADADASSQGADAKGLKTLEYLLYDESGNDAVLARYQGDVQPTQYQNYLSSVSQNVLSLATKLQDAWTGSNNYIGTFINSQGNDVSSSASLLVNTLSLYLDEIKNMKIGNAIGMGVKVNDDETHPDKIEYKIAEESLPVMVANIQSMKAAFDGGSGPGLDDLLDYVKAQKDSKELSTEVDDQFDDVINKLNAIKPSFANAVTSQTQKLEDVFNSLKQLIAYFKVDVANNLGITITFSDTDGD